MTKKSKKESTLYYFYSVGCGFCKKMDPIIDELNKKGHNILKLDFYTGLFIELKNSALFFVSFNLEFINSMASIAPIGEIILLRTFIF